MNAASPTVPPVTIRGKDPGTDLAVADGMRGHVATCCRRRHRPGTIPVEERQVVVPPGRPRSSGSCPDGAVLSRRGQSKASVKDMLAVQMERGEATGRPSRASTRTTSSGWPPPGELGEGVDGQISGPSPPTHPARRGRRTPGPRPGRRARGSIIIGWHDLRDWSFARPAHRPSLPVAARTVRSRPCVSAGFGSRKE